MKIVSLLPSATEIICLLGLESKLVGVTHKCDYPMSVKKLPVVTKTAIDEQTSSREIDEQVRQQLLTKTALYSIDMAMLEELRPDFIVTQSLCAVCAVAEQEVNTIVKHLPGPPKVFNLEPKNLEDIFTTILRLSEFLGVADRGQYETTRLREKLVETIAITKDCLRKYPAPGVVFLEWLDPLFNTGHWMPEIITYAGGKSRLSKPGKPSTKIHWEALQKVNPDVLFIACCGYTPAQTRADIPALSTRSDWQQLRCVQSGRVYIADGNAYFSKPGPRILDSLMILAHALYPDIHPQPENPAIAIG